MKQTLVIQLKMPLDERQLDLPAELLKEGKTVAFPTETVYGLGANALDAHAIDGIFKAKGRPSDNPLIVHISDVDMLKVLILEKQPYVDDLMRAFWPGPMTFIFRKKDTIDACVSGGLDTVGVRMPKHPVALSLIRKAGLPIAAPSANISGKPSPTQAKYVLEDLMGRVDCILEGEDCEVGLESTVLDVTGETPIILRPGAIGAEDIIGVVGACDVDPATLNHDHGEDILARSPGMKYKHYAPDAEVTVFIGDIAKMLQQMTAAIKRAELQNECIGLMIFEEDALILEKMLEGVNKDSYRLCTQGSIKHLETFAKQLFKDLRALDAHGCKRILIHGVEKDKYAHAIMNRLYKASEGRLIHC